MRHPCSTCTRPATLTITGRIPGKTCYSALTCDQCAPKHRERARKAGPVHEEPLEDRAQDALF
jgi:protein-arginine kinase activator protein McsA